MRLIDADALEARAYEIYVHASPEFKTRMNTLKALIDQAPTIDAVPVVHARWSTHQECSVCGDFARYSAYGEPYYSRYCPNCGAKMDGGAEA
jgi:hypothetical protein